MPFPHADLKWAATWAVAWAAAWALAWAAAWALAWAAAWALAWAAAWAPSSDLVGVEWASIHCALAMMLPSVQNYRKKGWRKKFVVGIAGSARVERARRKFRSFFSTSIDRPQLLATGAG